MFSKLQLPRTLGVAQNSLGRQEMHGDAMVFKGCQVNLGFQGIPGVAKGGKGLQVEALLDEHTHRVRLSLIRAARISYWPG